MEIIFAIIPHGGIVKEPFRFGDTAGKTAYVTDADTVLGKSSCEGDCAHAWPPVPAPPDAIASGDWTLVTQPDGSWQWAYAGYALYGSPVDAKPSDLRGIEEFDVLRVETAALRSAVEPFGHGLYWRIAGP